MHVRKREACSTERRTAYDKLSLLNFAALGVVDSGELEHMDQLAIELCSRAGKSLFVLVTCRGLVKHLRPYNVFGACHLF